MTVSASVHPLSVTLVFHKGQHARATVVHSVYFATTQFRHDKHAQYADDIKLHMALNIDETVMMLTLPAASTSEVTT